jgi:hypothetical protein
VLSEDGQKLLADPDIRKLPARPSVYARLPPDYHNPFAAARQGAYRYGNDASRERLGLVSSLFSQWLGQPHERLSALWARVHAGEAAGQNLAAVRERLTHPPLDATQATSPELLALFARRQDRGTQESPADDTLGRREIDWQFQAALRFTEAERLLDGMGL